MPNVVPKLWPGETFAILGTGPSLTADVVDHVRGKARVIAINAAHELAPWADVMYAADAAYWKHVKGAPAFTGLKYSLAREAAQWPDVRVLRIAGSNGLELDPTGLKTGDQSGYQAINLAVHLGASRILLLGYDMRVVGNRRHFTTNYPSGGSGNYTHWMRHFDTLVKPLEQLSIEVVNCTPNSALKVFPFMPLRDALPHVAEVAATAGAVEASL